MGDLTLRDTTIRGGKSDQGGGIYNDGVTVLLTRSTVTDNVAGDGGGIYNNGGTVTLCLVNITNSTLSQNITEGSYGGDIVAEGEVRTVRRVRGGHGRLGGVRH